MNKLISMFGAGWWKHDEEGYKTAGAGLEKVNGVWNYEGKPFTFEMSYLADTEFQAARGGSLQPADKIRFPVYNHFQIFCNMGCRRWKG